MKIIERTRDKVANFSDIKIGETFKVQHSRAGFMYMKVDCEGKQGSLELVTGKVRFWKTDLQCKLVHGEFAEC